MLNVATVVPPAQAPAGPPAVPEDRAASEQAGEDAGGAFGAVLQQVLATQAAPAVAKPSDQDQAADQAAVQTADQIADPAAKPDGELPAEVVAALIAALSAEGAEGSGEQPAQTVPAQALPVAQGSVAVPAPETGKAAVPMAVSQTVPIEVPAQELPASLPMPVAAEAEPAEAAQAAVSLKTEVEASAIGDDQPEVSKTADQSSSQPAAGKPLSAELQAKLEQSAAQVVTTPESGNGGKDEAKPVRLAQVTGSVSRTPDRGAAVEAATSRPAAEAKEESAQAIPSRPAGLKIPAAASAGERTPVDSSTSEQSHKPAVQAGTETQLGKQVVDADPAPAPAPIQPSSSAGGERSGQVDVNVAVVRPAAAQEQPLSHAAARGGENAPPAVNRQEVLDQVVQSAKLHAERGISRFEMQLQPPSLGKLNVVMDLKDGALNITFKVDNAAVKDALQNSLPQLRESLANQGVNVDGCDVRGFDRGSQQQDGSSHRPGAFSPGGRADSAEAEALAPETAPVALPSGLVDCWA